MRTTKRWTNATFTKRVDHEIGERRDRPAPAEPGVCHRCGAVYFRRHWIDADSPRARALRAAGHPAATMCPACRMAIAHTYGGEVRVAGSFVAGHAAEIERLIRNEAERAAENNPTARILRLDRTASDRMTILTTTEHLAQRLGHALQKAMGGAVTYHFAHEDKFATVTWTRAT
jgi:hypothetical protein